jgi:uncharacterized protein (DUF2344 family)
MIQAIAYALTLMSSQPVFCTETLRWDDNPLAANHLITLSFEGPDGKMYFLNYETKESKIELMTPYGRKCTVTVAAVYYKPNGDMYTLSAEPFEFEGCASKKKK